jgi:hypothetical protein
LDKRNPNIISKIVERLTSQKSHEKGLDIPPLVRSVVIFADQETFSQAHWFSGQDQAFQDTLRAQGL